MSFIERIPFFRSLSRRELLAMVILFFGYLLCAQIGRFFFTPPAVIQPAAGFALALLVLEGIQLWPALLAAATLHLLMGDVGFITGLSIALAHTLHAVVGAYVLKRYAFDTKFRHVRDMFLFIPVALLTSMIIPTLGIAGNALEMTLFDFVEPLRTNWLAWWAGIMIGDLVLASAMIRYLGHPSFERTRREYIELTIALITTTILSYVLYWTDTSEQTGGVVILLYLAPFVWFALRGGMRFMLIAFAITTIIGVTGILYGYHPPIVETGRRLITLEFFIATLAVIFYLFTAVVEERKRSARQLETQLARVESLLAESKRQDRAKSDFIAVFAHELRNPLAPIVSAIDLLKQRWNAEPEIAHVAHIIDDRIRIIVRLLDDLLDISRITEGKLRLQTEPVDLALIMHRAEISIQPHVRKRQQVLTVATPQKALIINADPVRIEQVFTNLLNNASKFTPDGGTVHLSAQLQQATTVEIRVQDTGVGIEADMLPRIFEPFLQAELSHRPNEGIGVGLSLTKQLVELHGGTIEARSAGEGKGAEFIVRLPIAHEHDVVLVTKQSTMHQTPTIHSRLKILIVDDNEAAANGLGILLTHVGNDVDFAYVGADVADKVAEFNPNVVILDIGLPDISGYDVASQLRKGGYRGKIIALTGYGQDEDKKKATEAGFDYHLTKPVGIADLQAVLVPQSA